MQWMRFHLFCVTMFRIKNARNFSRLKSTQLKCQKHLRMWFDIFLLIKIVQSFKIKCDSTRNCIRRRTKEPHKNVFLLTHSKRLVCCCQQIWPIASNHHKIDFNWAILCPMCTSNLFDSIIGKFPSQFRMLYYRFVL